MSPSPVIWLSVAITILLVFSIQYPLSTTFPIGGDAAAHIRTAQMVLATPTAPAKTLATLKNSNYPLSPFLLASTSTLPINWPDRFVWWATTGHILAGLALGLLLWRISSWRAAAAGIAIWALTPIGINNHFEDGTIPQLWSLIFLILTFERLAAGSIRGTLLMLAATTLTHLLSGFILIASLIMGTALLIPVRHRLAPRQATLIKYLGVFIGIISILFLYKIITGIDWPFIEPQSEDLFLLDIIKSKFTPWVVLSIPGIAILISKLRHSLPTSTSLLGFFWLSFLLTTNSTLNVGLWENRFRTYFILAVCLAASLALSYLIRAAFKSTTAQSIFLILLFTTLIALTWRDNAAVYRFYEDPANNARLHPEVLAAIEWMAANLPPSSYLASSAASRQAEWIPALTSLQWQDLGPYHRLFSGQEDKLLISQTNNPFTHVVFLTRQEDINPTILNNPDLFPVVFQNPSTVIMQIP